VIGGFCSSAASKFSISVNLGRVGTSAKEFVTKFAAESSSVVTSGKEFDIALEIVSTGKTSVDDMDGAIAFSA
jgi:hypothetical protein